MAVLNRRLAGSRAFPAAAVAFLFAGFLPSQTASESALESPVKAAFVYNFAKFVEWPSESPASKDGAFVIGVLRDSPLFAALKGLDGQEVHSRRLLVRTFPTVNEAACQILFVDGSQTASFAQESERLRGRPVLTVGEGDAFLQAGGMIALVRIDGKIRFRVRPRQAETAHLLISSKLLKLADRTVE